MQKEIEKPVYEGKPEALVRERRRQIFEAAASVFAEKGFHNATVREIAQAAGLGKGTVYEYVRSKKEILFLVIEEGHNVIFEQLDLIVNSELPPEEKWHEAVLLQLRILESHSDVVKAILPEVKGLEKTEHNRMEEMKIRYIDRYSKLFEDCVKAGVFRKLDCFVVCELILNCCILWSDSESIRVRSGNDVEKYEKLLSDVFRKGILK